MNPTIRKPAEGRTVAVVGDVYRFLATGEDTNGRYALWEAVPPGGGPPPHVHSREEEGFYVLDGDTTFTVNDERVVAGRDVRQHAGRDATQLQERVRPPGEDADLGRPRRPGADVLRGRRATRRGSDDGPAAHKEEIDKMAAVAPKYGIEIRLPHP